MDHVKANAYELARLAGVASPDTLESPGAIWLRLVASMAAELDASDPDDIAQAADSVVPVYTHDRWQVFVDLAAYNEDNELVDWPKNLTDAAGIALYQVAERLLNGLLGDEPWRGGEDEPDRRTQVSDSRTACVGAACEGDDL